MNDVGSRAQPPPGGQGRGGPAQPSEPLLGERKGARLQEILEDLVDSLEPGAKLPSERELAERYGVARMTVRGAVGGLVQQGLVHRLQGHGTFVSEPRLAQPTTLTSFTEDMTARGLRPGSIVLAQEVVPSPAPIALGLEVPEGEPIVRIERIRSGDGEPIALERSHLPARRFPGLAEVDLEVNSLYATLAEVYGCELASSEQRIAAVRLSHIDAHLLHAEVDVPALRVERVTRGRDGAPIELVRSVYRGDRFELHTEQDR